MARAPHPLPRTVEEQLGDKLAEVRRQMTVARERVSRLETELRAARTALEEARAALEDLAELRATLAEPPTRRRGN
jgi:hypothetical protein